MKLLLVAGEVSGDQHASALIDALRRRVGSLEVSGLAGDGCRDRGMRLLAHQKDLAVVGLVEAIGKLRFARRLIALLVAEAVAERVDAAVLIDSPDFNLPLARRLAARGIPVVFYVSPQVWAWRSRRARSITTLGRAVLVLFRFEKRWYDERGLGERVTWVGHPLVDVAEQELLTPYPAPASGRRRVVLMPGSREGEIRFNLPVMRDAVERLCATRDDLDVTLIQADSIPLPLLAGIAGPALRRWNVVAGPHLALLAASDVLIVASGTATVEGLLACIPMVVVYRVNPVSFALARVLVRIDDVAMANIVSRDGSGTRAVPELLQNEATPEAIADATARFLDEPAKAAEARRRLALGREELGPAGAAGRAAEALLSALGLAATGRETGR